ncbi:MAG: restriction endonuclease subunit S [Dysgonomonas sp.]|uniref:restriction endonuclease subunit S n=1 Tax=Dysgonomonas sp. TaxID=1891233 RepID=UPI0039E69C42
MKEQQEKYRLPKGWIEVNLENIVVLNKGKKPNLFKEKMEGTIPYLDIEGFEKNIVRQFSYPSESTMIDETSLAMVWDGARSGLVFKGQKGALGSTIMKITSFLVENNYLYYFLVLKQDFIQKNTKGTGIPHVNPEILGKLKLPLTSLIAQKLIVSQIEILFSKIEETEKGLKKAKKELSIYKYALLKDGFEGKLTTKWREENAPNSAEKILQDLNITRKKFHETALMNWKEEISQWERSGKNGMKPAKPKEFQIFPYFEKDFDELSKLPIEWKWIHWNEILDYKENSFKRGPFGSTLTKSLFVKNGYKVYEQYCAINDDCSFERYYITPEKYEELKSFSVRDGDYLISCSGVTLGRITQIPKKYKEGIINQALLRVRTNNEVLNSKFFLYFFRSPYFQKQIFENSKGSAIPNIKGVKELKIIPVPLLSIEEQNVIVEILESRFTLVNNLEKTVDNVLNEITALKHSILKKAFEGRLVNYTSNESVEKLLNDIQEEKRLYLENQKELNRSKPKKKKQMEEKKSILDILKESDSPITAQELWEKSTSEGDIERFYSEIKEIYHQIDELKSKTESLLSLKDENK